MAEQTLQEIRIHLEYIREKQDEITEHLRTLNGRTAKVEQDVAIIQATSKTAGRNWGAGAGAVGGALASLLQGLFRQ